jgi:superfamily II RNA helicase
LPCDWLQEEEDQELLQQDPFNWQIIVVLSVNAASKKAEKPVPEPLGSTHGEAVPIPVPLPLIVRIAKDCMDLPDDLRPISARQRLRKSLHDLVQMRYGGNSKVPELDPVQDMKRNEPGLKFAVEELARCRKKLEQNVIYQTEQKNGNGQENEHDKIEFTSLAQLAMERADLQAKIAQSQLTNFKSQVKMRRKVLQKLGHLTSDGLLTAKGKAAAEVRAPCFGCR